jgi:hypothetical protein
MPGCSARDGLSARDVAVLADVVHVHAQPVAGAVHVELQVGLVGDDLIQRAFQQAQVQHALRQHLTAASCAPE